MDSPNPGQKPLASDLSHHLSRSAKYHHPRVDEEIYCSRARKCLTNPMAYHLAGDVRYSRDSYSDSQLPKDQYRLRSSIRQFSFILDNIPYRDPDVAIQHCNTNGLSDVFRLLCNEWYSKRDWQGDRPGLLVEEYTHSGVTTLGKSLGFNTVPVRMDADGMLSWGAGGLAEILGNWKTKQGRRPHLMYTVSTGQVLTGRVSSMERKRQIYTLCHDYDVIIIEAEPHWHLQYSHGDLHRNSGSREANTTVIEPSNRGFFDSLVPSYLSLDTDGRVIKLDSTLATLSLYHDQTFIIAQADFIKRLRQTSGTGSWSRFGQHLIEPSNDNSPEETLCIRGCEEELEQQRNSHEKRMNSMAEALDLKKYYVAAPTSPAEDHCDTSEWLHLDKVQMYSFSRPDSGVFIWIRILFPSHPLADKVSGPTLSRALWTMWTSRKYSMLVLPAELLAASEEIAQKDGWQFFGLCFGSLVVTQIHCACETFAEGLREFWEIEDEALLPTT